MRRVLLLLVCGLLLVALSGEGSCQLSTDNYVPQRIQGIWQACYGTDPQNPYTCVSGNGTAGICPAYFNDLGSPVGKNYPLIRNTCH
jgi:hypothetical protein